MATSDGFDEAQRDHRLGRASLHPAGPVVAGEMGTWTLTYTVGSYGIDEGGTLKIARRFASDWGRPQFDDPAAPNYTTVTTDGDAKVAARYDLKAHVRPWMKCVVIDVYDGSLSPGEHVTVVFGDTRGGSPGMAAQSFIESAHEMRVLVDPTNACLVRRIPSSPVFAIVAGPPVKLVVEVPTRGTVGEPSRVFVKGEDRWGNPTPAPADVSLTWLGDDVTPALARFGNGEVVLDAPGTGRVQATWRGQTWTSNPLTVQADAPALRTYWADLHAQSDATVGTGTELEYFAFGRDQANLDVMSHQGNDFQVTDEDWRKLGDAVEQFHEDGRFVVFPGFEWSANTPAGGDRNVIYRRDDAPIFRSSHWQVPEIAEDERTPAHPASDLYAKLKAHVDPSDVLVASHCGGRYADIRKYYDAELEPLVEVCSCWGVFEWLLWDAFESGYRVGVMANSDGHKGRPGAEGPGAGQFGIYGGLTAILAPTLTRDAVFDALRARRCYGTTGPRIDLRFAVDGAPMGSQLPTTGPVQVEASVRGTGPVEALQLWAGRRVVAQVRAPELAELSASRRVRLRWGGARIRGRGRRATWDGEIRIEGATIERAATFAFDSPNDGIEVTSPTVVRVRSRTTGDEDGVDLWLSSEAQGRVTFASETATVDTDLASLAADGTPTRFEVGGLDLHVEAMRYAEEVATTMLSLRTTFDAPAGHTTPLFVKAIQTDGHMAWASPIYLG